MKEAIVSYVIDRLRGFSMWRGIAARVATGGVLIAPEQLDAVHKTFIAVLGLAAVFTPALKKHRPGRRLGSSALRVRWAARNSPWRRPGGECQTSAKRHMPPMRAAAMITRTAKCWAVTAVRVASVM